MMRILLCNFSLLLVLFIQGLSGEDLNNDKSVKNDSPGAQVTHYLTDHGTDVLQQMKNHFDLSLNYLYTGISYGSQSVNRPGMSKVFREQSDSHWQDGIGLLKKHMERGGKWSELKKNFIYTGSNTIGDTEDAANKNSYYLNSMKKLLQDSKMCFKNLNNLHRMAGRRKHDDISPHHDGEWSHYLEEKLEHEAEKIRKYAGHVTNLESMFKSGIALKFFDSNL